MGDIFELTRKGSLRPSILDPRAGRVVRQLLKELRRDPEGHRSAFAQARRKEVDALLASTSNPKAIADRLEYIARFDLPAYFYDRLLRQIASLKLDAITGLIREELSLERQVLGAYGPRDAARSFLRAAGMAGP